MNIKDAFDNRKLTENGDLSYNKVSTDDKLLNILFLTEYYTNHIDEVPVIGSSERDKIFARFIRDPRLGLGRRDLGRRLMMLSECSIEEIVKSGRVDDLFYCSLDIKDLCKYLKKEIESGNELVKKWMPRYSSKNVKVARLFAAEFGMNKQQYGKFIKCDTTENKLSRKRVDEIEFDKIPSLCLLKYYKRFARKEDTKERFKKYIDDVKSGKKEMHISTTTVYDIYKNSNVIDADLFFDKIEKIKINAIPIVDTSASMFCDDAMGKALSIGHYIAKCSTYMPNFVVSFSSRPTLIKLGVSNIHRNIDEIESQYKKEILSMRTGDCSNTDLGKVMELFKDVDDLPEYLVVLTDMEFDAGSSRSKGALMNIWKEKGYSTKIVWWNLNSRNITCPEMDKNGNIFMSGYSPYLLKYLEVGFDGKMFLNKLLEEYKEKIEK